MSPCLHQYIERSSGRIRDERFVGDPWIRLLYSELRENAPALFRALTSARMSQLLAQLNYDAPLARRLLGNRNFLKTCGVDESECVPQSSGRGFRTWREIFERKIHYERCRPMSENPSLVVSPCDARVLVGSLSDSSAVFIKNKFFLYEELLGPSRSDWLRVFRQGECALFRLTPDKYHYNHAPVSGRVADHYVIDGAHHSCNPQAVVALATPYSKNRRVVTILDTDFPDGTGVGFVAMIEVVALMIGDIVQCYSECGYGAPRPVTTDLFLRRGCPKSLFRPGSSTVVLLFQKGRVRFSEDLLANAQRVDVQSRFSNGFSQTLVETDVRVRETIAHPSEFTLRQPHGNSTIERGV